LFDLVQLCYIFSSNILFILKNVFFFQSKKEFIKIFIFVKTFFLLFLNQLFNVLKMTFSKARRSL